MVALLVAFAAPALAQDNETVDDNASEDNLTGEEFDDSVPPPEDDYLTETEMALEDEELREEELDDSVPPPDDSYLTDAEREAGADSGASAATPGLGAALVAAAVGATAAVVARRR